MRDNDHLGPGDVYDIDPGQGTLRGRLRALDDVFNAAYSLVINELQAAFSNRSDRLGAGIDNMLGFVQTTAKLMMAAQITPDGPHARPTFAYDASVSTRHDLDGYLRALDEADRRVLERNGVVLPA